ncbi:hypothetical protein C8R43DRAFT_942961 [Mycena crocata]|nr:hypothetical protein C8R43DRAFT_942961 [Mycena crocata]
MAFNSELFRWAADAAEPQVVVDQRIRTTFEAPPAGIIRRRQRRKIAPNRAARRQLLQAVKRIQLSDMAGRGARRSASVERGVRRDVGRVIGVECRADDTSWRSKITSRRRTEINPVRRQGINGALFPFVGYVNFTIRKVVSAEGRGGGLSPEASLLDEDDEADVLWSVDSAEWRPLSRIIFFFFLAATRDLEGILPRTGPVWVAAVVSAEHRVESGSKREVRLKKNRRWGKRLQRKLFYLALIFTAVLQADGLFFRVSDGTQSQSRTYLKPGPPSDWSLTDSQIIKPKTHLFLAAVIRRTTSAQNRRNSSAEQEAPQTEQILKFGASAVAPPRAIFPLLWLLQERADWEEVSGHFGGGIKEELAGLETSRVANC